MLEYSTSCRFAPRPISPSLARQESVDMSMHVEVGSDDISRASMASFKSPKSSSLFLLTSISSILLKRTMFSPFTLKRVCERSSVEGSELIAGMC